ncbi:MULTISPECIES: DUF6274 family protein [unclassified Streptomyces]|uniref:DUF6274 family protein n=1 Tax=unclassified Streptomyces TaxID=2593676 RepID=UPI0005A62DEB|nr:MULTISPECIES: DUF6274 family protein [unclassified Streptomyces]ODA69579.1 hypothetical protein APS67_006279 [Streptomyces sp. AVP053U2]
MPASARHETRALLRAHLSAASSFGHHTRHCPVCHRLLRLAMDSAPRTPEASEPTQQPARPAEPTGPTDPTGPTEPTERPPERVGGEDASTA